MMILVACSYQIGDGGWSYTYQTISVPLAEGDEDGDLTCAIVEQITRSGSYEYYKEGGAAILKVRIIDVRDENIGFRYDRKHSGKLKKEIIPTETRLFITAEVTLVAAGSCEPLLGPALLTADVDFDHDYYTSLGEINVFSLGQLNNYDVAWDAAQKPLNRELARKIVDFISDSW